MQSFWIGLSYILILVIQKILHNTELKVIVNVSKGYNFWHMYLASRHKDFLRRISRLRIYNTPANALWLPMFELLPVANVSYVPLGGKGQLPNHIIPHTAKQRRLHNLRP